MAIVGREMERCPHILACNKLVLALCLNVGSAIHQQLRNRFMPICGREMERRILVLA